MDRTEVIFLLVTIEMAAAISSIVVFGRRMYRKARGMPAEAPVPSRTVIGLIAYSFAVVALFFFVPLLALVLFSGGIIWAVADIWRLPQSDKRQLFANIEKSLQSPVVVAVDRAFVAVVGIVVVYSIWKFLS